VLRRPVESAASIGWNRFRVLFDGFPTNQRFLLQER
jgi:hypothetical protein